MRPSSLAVIGLGAIGGSLAWQSRLAGIARVVGYSPDPAEAVQALKASAITELADTPVRAVREAELVVLAVPPRPPSTSWNRLPRRWMPARFLPTCVASRHRSFRAPWQRESVIALQAATRSRVPTRAASHPRVPSACAAAWYTSVRPAPPRATAPPES